MWFYRNNSDKFEGCTLWWSKRDHWKVGIFPRILTTLYELSPAKKSYEISRRKTFSSSGRRLKGFLFKWWRRSIMISLFVFILFWHFDMSAHSTIFVFMTTTSSLVFTTTPHTPHYHHRCRISRVWQTSKGRLWSLERLASRGHDGRARGDPSQHRTAQQRQWEQNGSEPWRCDCRWHCLCSPKFSWLHSWLGTGGWWWHYYTRGLVLIWVLALFSYLL